MLSVIVERLLISEWPYRDGVMSHRWGIGGLEIIKLDFSRLSPLWCMGTLALAPQILCMLHGGRMNTCSSVVSYRLVALIHVELIIFILKISAMRRALSVCWTFSAQRGSVARIRCWSSGFCLTCWERWVGWDKLCYYFCILKPQSLRVGNLNSHVSSLKQGWN